MAELIGQTADIRIKSVSNIVPSIYPLNVDSNYKLPISWGIMRQQLDLLNLDKTYMFDENMQASPSWFEVPLSGDMKGIKQLR